MPHSIADRDSGLWTSGIIEKIGSVTNWPTELTLHPTPSLSPQGTPVKGDTRCWFFPSHPFYYIQLMFCCSTFPSLFLFFLYDSRFQQCATYEDGSSCHATFLEFSYTLWNLMRTAIFISMCWNMNGYAWKQPESDYSRILVRCLMLNNNAYVELLFCAAVTSILLDGHCVLQTLHNTFCVLNLLCFIITLNGYHKRTVIMVFYSICSVVMNVQSVIVSLYHVYRNLQLQRNGDFVVTLMYIVELYLMFLVLFDCSSRVINKVLNPRKDIMAWKR